MPTPIKSRKQKIQTIFSVGVGILFGRPMTSIVPMIHYELLAVYEFPTKSVSEKPERQLSDDVANVRSCIHEAP